MISCTTPLAQCTDRPVFSQHYLLLFAVSAVSWCCSCELVLMLQSSSGGRQQTVAVADTMPEGVETGLTATLWCSLAVVV